MTLPDHNEWLQLTVDVAPDGLERWEGALLAVGALSITYRDAQDNPVFEPGPGEIALWDSPKLTALFPQSSASAPVLRDLSAQLGAIDVSKIQIETLPDRHWERAWLDDFAPMQFGERLWICPRGIESPQPDAVNLRLDPGLAFGTGTHPTTAMCLRWLDATDVGGATVVDYGCGSGVLGIAALLLGAESVYATDIDPQALQATCENAKANGVAERVHECSARAIADVAADIVIANILAATLIDLAETLASLCKPDGKIVLSGLLHDQTDDVWTAYSPWFGGLCRYSSGEWACLSARRLDQ